MTRVESFFAWFFVLFVGYCLLRFWMLLWSVPS